MSLILHTWSRWQTAQSATRGNHSSCVFGKFNANSGAHWDIATWRDSGWTQGGLKLDKLDGDLEEHVFGNFDTFIAVLKIRKRNIQSLKLNFGVKRTHRLIDSTIDCSGWSVVELLYKGAHADALPNLSEPCWIDWSQQIDWIEPTIDIWSCETSCEITKAEISIESVTEPGRTQRPWPTCYHTQTWTCPEYFEYFELIWICLICFSCDWCDWSGSSHHRTVATVATCSCAWSICWLFLLCHALPIGFPVPFGAFRMEPSLEKETLLDWPGEITGLTALWPLSKRSQNPKFRKIQPICELESKIKKGLYSNEKNLDHRVSKSAHMDACNACIRMVTETCADVFSELHFQCF